MWSWPARWSRTPERNTPTASRRKWSTATASSATAAASPGSTPSSTSIPVWATTSPSCPTTIHPRRCTSPASSAPSSAGSELTQVGRLRGLPLAADPGLDLHDDGVGGDPGEVVVGVLRVEVPRVEVHAEIRAVDLADDSQEFVGRGRDPAAVILRREDHAPLGRAPEQGPDGPDDAVRQQRRH